MEWKVEPNEYESQIPTTTIKEVPCSLKIDKTTNTAVENLSTERLVKQKKTS